MSIMLIVKVWGICVLAGIAAAETKTARAGTRIKVEKRILDCFWSRGDEWCESCKCFLLV